ncbi:MAG: ABC transporter permease, partial [Vicinamibacteria bacterium]|nr:ABC transporter permease [Vicinamibacteria bacterium]
MRTPKPSRAERAYRLLLRMLPGDFRAEFGREMEGVFLDEQREAARAARRGASWQLWLRTLGGILATAPAQHVDVLTQDLTYAGRSLAQTPVFAGTAVLALALGIGGMCAVFTLVDQVVLRKLPVPQPDRLVHFDSPSFSYPVIREVQRQVPSLQRVFGWSIERRHVTFDGGPEPVDVMEATGGIHQTLGITPAAGRLLRPADDEGREAVAVLSYDAWQQRFGGDGGVIGRTLLVEHTPVSVVGVTPKGFFGVAPGLAPELTIPATLAPRLRPDDAGILEEVGQSWLDIMGRLNDSITIAEADAALQTTWPRLLEIATPTTTPAKDRLRYLGRQTRLMAADTGFSRVRRRFQQPLWLLTALVALLLAIGCGTIANMMLSRTLARGHELSLRRAIGAGRGRLLRQLLTEGLLLTSAGAALGVLFGIWGSQALVRLLSTASSAITVDSTPTLLTLGGAAGLALAIALVTTACSALCALRADAGDALRAAPRTAGASAAERRLGAWLVSVQVALSLTLVVGASVFALNLHRLLTAPIGLDRTRLIVVHADALFAGHTEEKLARYYDSALDRLAALPGIVSASYSRKAPVSDSDGSWWEQFAVDDRPADARGERTYLNAVSDDYFATTGVRVLAGRVFDRRDAPGAPPVIVVNARLSEQMFGTESPLGRRLGFEDGGQRQEFTIVGVVDNAAYQYVHEDARAVAFFPYGQAAGMLENRNLVFELKTSGPPASAIGAVREALRQEDSRVPVRLETLEARIAESLVQERALALLAMSLGGTALLLAAAALYGLMAYSATARTREFGVRVALGATPSAIGRLVLRDAGRITVVGIAIGLGITLALG